MLVVHDGGNAHRRTTADRLLIYVALGVGTLFLSSRLLPPSLHAYAWPYFMAAATIALFITLNIDTGIARHFGLALVASNVIFGIAGAFTVALFLSASDPRQEAPGMAFGAAYLLVGTNLLVWPLGARLLFRTSWPVAVSLGIVVFFALPTLMFLGLLIALLAWRPP
jgi:hypothetical protein